MTEYFISKLKLISSLFILFFLLLLSYDAKCALAVDVTVAGTERLSLSNGSTFASNSVTTTVANTLVLAIISINPYDSGVTLSASAVSGGGLTFTYVLRYNAGNGSAEVWRALATSVLSAQTITATLSTTGGANRATGFVTIIAFSGVSPTGTNGSGAVGATNNGGSASGLPSVAVTTTRDNSWVVGAFFNWNSSTSQTPGSSQTVFGSATVDGGGLYWGQRMNGTTASSGTSVTLNDTAPSAQEWSGAICEVLPPSALHRVIQY